MKWLKEELTRLCVILLLILLGWWDKDSLP